MRKLEEIEKELAEARAALAGVEGTPTEVYSRIVGYYRSVRNWNRGKREEYGERRLYEVDRERLPPAAMVQEKKPAYTRAAEVPEAAVRTADLGEQRRLLLFVRPACPACPTAKDAAGKLGIPVDLVDADTDAGLAEAARRNVLSTPTAILISADGVELARARDARSISAFADGGVLSAAAM